MTITEDRKLGSLLRAGLIKWRNLRDSTGKVHRSIGPWQIACAPETTGSRRTMRPTDDPVSCGGWPCETKS